MINIVERYKSAAMQRMAKPLENYLGAQISEEIVDGVNFHMPWHFVIDADKGRNVIQYTHCNPGDERALEEACARSEMVMCMSYQGRQELLDLGVPIEKTWVAYPGSGNFPARRKNIGLVGYKQPNGRKRAHMLIDLAWLLPEHVRNMLHFIIVGGGWQDITAEAKQAGLSIQHMGEKTDHVVDKQLEELYQGLDALLVTAHVEGGPLPILEAMSAGVPVFSPHVGFGADWLNHPYNGAEELAQQLTDFVTPTLDRMMLARVNGWDTYAENTALMLSPLTGEDYAPERGWPRYRQLIDIVDAEKPETIYEIGTWSGTRAQQMIQVAQRHHDKVTYVGFDLFEQSTPGKVRAEFSKVGIPLHVVETTLNPTGADIFLFAGDTKETLWKYHVKSAGKNLIFIDGGHSLETIENDWLWAKDVMNGAVVFDDYVVDGPEGYGCQSIIDNLSDEFVVERLPKVTETDNGKVSMVKVSRA